MADWNKPSLSDLYTNFRQFFSDRLDDAARQFNSATVTATNIPTGTIRWNSTGSKDEIWTGSAWTDKAATYGISISGNAGTLGGHAAAYFQVALVSGENIKTVNGSSLLGSGDVVIPGSPVGSVCWFAASSPPTGYLKANGAAINRTTYSSLFGVIGTTFGSGDGSTTFNLPDLRGEFIRGWDDSRGADAGRGFGSFQNQDFLSHTHPVGVGYDGASMWAGSTYYGKVVSGSYSTSAAGGSETRPRNVALLACIKY